MKSSRKSANKEGPSMRELCQYREQIMKQKNFLVDILSKIEKQIHALQVERLHLKNSLLSSESLTPKRPGWPIQMQYVKTEPGASNHSQQNSMEQELDLTLPSSRNDYEEIEDEDEEENEKLIMELNANASSDSAEENEKRILELVNLM